MLKKTRFVVKQIDGNLYFKNIHLDFVGTKSGRGYASIGFKCTIDVLTIYDKTKYLSTHRSNVQDVYIENNKIRKV